MSGGGVSAGADRAVMRSRGWRAAWQPLSARSPSLPPRAPVRAKRHTNDIIAGVSVYFHINTRKIY